MSSHINIQDSSKCNNWSQVRKYHLVKEKTVVKSLKKSAIATYNHFETLHNLQRSMGNTTPEIQKRPHHTQKVSHQDNMANGVASH